jgi:hypothetical protein
MNSWTDSTELRSSLLCWPIQQIIRPDGHVSMYVTRLHAIACDAHALTGRFLTSRQVHDFLDRASFTQFAVSLFVRLGYGSPASRFITNACAVSRITATSIVTRYSGLEMMPSENNHSGRTGRRMADTQKQHNNSRERERGGQNPRLHL